LRVPGRALARNRGGPPLSEIVVNHLTRVGAERICVAGIDPATRRHVRPVAAGQDFLPRELLADSGGPFELGARVELGNLTPALDPPHIEDHAFDPAKAHRIDSLDPRDYLDLIDSVSERTLRLAFGSDLRRVTEKKYATDPGLGDCSLACIRLRGPTALEFDGFDHLVLRFEQAAKVSYAKIADLRFYGDDGTGLRHSLFDDVSGRLREGVRAWAMFGLARAWKVRANVAERHWLQVNGICLEDHPLGP
jgi:hypothetical protein